tara:strand:+ start:228 stop:644 length:417 start_codon:yes stop_codon:yes gene_type:complete
MTTTTKKTWSNTEYENHGNIMYDIGKAHAFQSIMKTEVIWSVNLSDKFEHWDLDTVIFGNGNLKDILFINKILTNEMDKKGDFIPQIITSKAKYATVREIWLAAERTYKIAKEEYEDWHQFLEIVELHEGVIYSFFGS